MTNHIKIIFNKSLPDSFFYINQIFVDENISIKIDINEIRAESGDSLAIKNIIYGEIHYPSETGYIGKIIYIKSSFTDTNEPPAVKGYAARNPKFPQQSTGD